MDIPVQTISLVNGLTINIYDRTKRYYEAFYLVRLEVVCEIALHRVFANESEFLEAKKLFGDLVVYRRTLEHMGVPESELAAAKKTLMRNFEQNSIPYFTTVNFPQKIVTSECIRARKRLGSQQPNGRTYGRI